MAKVQTFLKENADKVKAVIGENAVAAAALSAVTEIEPESVVSGLLQQVGDAATDAKDAAVEAVEGAAQDAADAAQQKVDEAKDAAQEKANEAIDDAAAAAKKKLGL